MVDVETRAETLLDSAVEAARELAESLRRAGWYAVVVTDRKIRYWCPGPECKHETWVEVNPKSVTYFDRARKHLGLTTCWKEETND